ncbi:MAG: DoxX family membrane protein [bacterium]|nr:DoxX family membrane protein [bacterium]
MSRIKTILLWVMAVLYMFAGYNHLVNPAFYVAIMPPELPNPEWLNVISGLAEIVLGVFLLEPRTRVLAAWGLIALLIAVFPTNVYVAVENVGTEGPGSGNAMANMIRLPFQALFILWAWWYTRPDAEGTE